MQCATGHLVCGTCRPKLHSSMSGKNLRKIQFFYNNSNVQERIINICRRAKEVKLMNRRYENLSTFIPVIYSYNNLSRTKTYGKW